MIRDTQPSNSNDLWDIHLLLVERRPSVLPSVIESGWDLVPSQQVLSMISKDDDIFGGFESALGSKEAILYQESKDCSWLLPAVKIISRHAQRGGNIM